MHHADGWKIQSWRTAAPAFSRREAETWSDAVRRDAEQIVANHGELPAIDRYAVRIDPACHPEAACLAVLAAFERAPAWTDVLAEAWRARYPAWSDAIDAAVGISSLDAGRQAMEAVGRRIGAVAPDGLGRYELLELIGEGSSGLVFRAVDHVFLACGEPSEVAVKLIPRTAAEVDAGLREAGFARRISHGGVARVLDAGRIEPVLARELGCGEAGIFIVHEFIHGQPLWVWKACHPERDAESCGSIVASIREALDACHASGIIHGDLNPANILIEASGRTRIIDFGRSARGPERGESKSREHDHERLEAIRRWLLRDLPRSKTALRRARVGWAAAAVVSLGTLAALFRSELSRMDARTDAGSGTGRVAGTLPVPDASVGGYQLFKQDGRVILIPGGMPAFGNLPPGNTVDGKTPPKIESIQRLDPGMLTIRIPEGRFVDMFGEPTGEVGPGGLAVYRVSRDRLNDQIARLVSDGNAFVPARGATEPEATARVSDAMLRELFGDSVFADGNAARLLLARSILETAPVAETDRDSRVLAARGLALEADTLRRSGKADSGLELLAAATFLSADANGGALQYALQAADPACVGLRRDFAATIESIAAGRTGSVAVGVDQSMVQRLADRLGAPGLAKFPWGP